MAAPTMEQCVTLQKGRERCLVGSGTELRSSSREKGTCQSQVLCRDLALLPAGKNLPKKFVAFPPREHVNSLPKMSVTQECCRWQAEPRVLAERGLRRSQHSE